jgi:hypothetical protein
MGVMLGRPYGPIAVASALIPSVDSKRNRLNQMIPPPKIGNSSKKKVTNCRITVHTRLAAWCAGSIRCRPGLRSKLGCIKGLTKRKNGQREEEDAIRHLFSSPGDTHGYINSPTISQGLGSKADANKLKFHTRLILRV